MRKTIAMHKKTASEPAILWITSICLLVAVLWGMVTVGKTIFVAETVAAETMEEAWDATELVCETTTVPAIAAATTVTTTVTGKYHSVPIQTFRVKELAESVLTTLDYTDWWYSEREDCHYLFLPATVDRSRLFIECSSKKGTIYINDQPIVSGQVTDVLQTGDSFSLRVDAVDCGLLRVLQSDVGCVFLSTESGSLDYIDRFNGNEESGSILMLNAAGGVEYQGELETIKGRGNSSWDYSLKKPYNIKLPKKEDLYGMGAAKKWALLSNYLDHSMIRNAVAMTLSQEAGCDYTMQYVYVDLYANGEYRGTYQIMQRVQIQKTRVNIRDLEEETEEVNESPLSSYRQVIVGGNRNSYDAGVYKYWDIPNNPQDITGGYLLQFQTTNRFPKAESGFVTTRGQCVEVNGPEYCTQAQLLYIRTFVQELEDAIYAPDGKNAKGKHYSEYLDVDSIALSYLIQEITNNPDGSYTSFYFWKESDTVGDGKLHCGPAWDFDLSMANFGRVIAGHSSNDPSNLFIINMLIHRQAEDTMEPCLGWLGTLMQKESFLQLVAGKYFTNFDDTLTMLLGESDTSISGIGGALTQSAAMNNGRWYMLGTNRRLGPVNGYTYAETLEYLRTFFQKRQTFLQKEWLPAALEPLVDQLGEALLEISLSAYDTNGKLDLARLQQTGAKEIRAAETFEAGCTALQVAIASFQTVPRAEVAGDFNDDGTTDYLDATALLVYYTDYLIGQPVSVSATQMRNGDVDKNGVLDAIDGMHILRYAVAATAGLEYTFPDAN